MKDDKNLEKILTDDEKKAIAVGEAFAVPIAKSKISNMLFTVALALLVFAAIVPSVMSGFSVLMYYSALLGAAGWLVLAKIYANMNAHMITSARITKGITEMLIKTQAEVITKQRDRLVELGELSDETDV